MQLLTKENGETVVNHPVTISKMLNSKTVILDGYTFMHLHKHATNGFKYDHQSIYSGVYVIFQLL